jgi:CubicO group peptidase (beta-lactamase class C family)
MKVLFYILLIVLVNSGCDKNYSSKFSYEAPIQLDDGLRIGNLVDEDMDEGMLLNAVGKIEKGKYGEVHSMLIYKNGKLVFEDYFEGHTYQWDAPGHYGEYVNWTSDMRHCIHSDTKSITSLCIGIAIDKGFIKSVHQSVFDYLPNYQHFNTNNKKYITIEHLLTMNSGLQWDEWGVSLGSIENDQIGIWFWEDGPINYVLGKDFAAEPGAKFNYSGGDIQLLAEILHNATGMQLDEFSAKYLFEPLGITTYDWWLIFQSGEIQAAGGLKLRPRDMIKIGAMMLNKGVWKGSRIISENWIHKCMVPYLENKKIKVPGEDLGYVGYAYTWWTKNFTFQGDEIDAYFALGWGGQKIIIIPALDMVVVFTGANYNSKVHQYKIFKRNILPALEKRN